MTDAVAPVNTEAPAAFARGTQARCGNPACEKIHSLGAQVFGPERTILADNGLLVDARQALPVCSDGCREAAKKALRQPATPDEEDEAAALEFHRRFYDAGRRGGTWTDVKFFGVPALKNPLDLWVLQEAVFDVRPDLVVEVGTYKGGTAVFLAAFMDAMGHGFVTTIDVQHREHLPVHSRISYVVGSSTNPKVVEEIARRALGVKTMVVLDGDHSKENVLAELRAYGPLVSEGSYLVVDDTNVNGNPVLPRHGPGPAEAVREFLESPEGASFEVDPRGRKFLFSFQTLLRKVPT